MNLYQLHARPELLLNYHEAQTQVPHIAWDLAKTNQQKRQLEHLWAQDSHFAYPYARFVLVGKFALGEPVIAQNPEQAWLYARNVLQHRWPEAEDTILTSPEFTWYYLDDLVRAPWPEAEPVIAQDPDFSYFYVKKYLRYTGAIKNAQRWLQQRILKRSQLPG